MILHDIAMLLTSSNRSKAYVQLLAANGLLPAFCLLMTTDENALENEASTYIKQGEGDGYFNADEPLLYTLRLYNIPYKVIYTNNVNEAIVIDAIKVMEHQYIIYSGFAGQILRGELFKIGKKYLHVHPGLLPSYRGSTTIYYSLLSEGICGATAIFLDEGIDTGNVLMSKTFAVPRGNVNLDYVFDPYIRAEMLVNLLRDFVATGEFVAREQELDLGDVFYIIHPVLKHIAILRHINTARDEYHA